MDEEKTVSQQLADLADDFDDVPNPHVTFLRQMWINERAAPELLFFEDVIAAKIKEQIDEQQELILETRTTGEEDFICNLYQMEIDRLSFMLTSYFRTRIKKIERHVLYILMNEEMVKRLSPDEFAYAQGYLNLVERHFNQSFLDQIPEKFRGLTEDNMVTKPNLSHHVFMRVKDQVGAFQVSDDGDDVDLRTDDILAASYSRFKGLLLADKIELI